MRDDQIQQLEDLSSDLIDVALEECDPKTWPGAGKPIADMTKDERGDRYWSKKNGAATVMIAAKIRSLIDQRTRPDWAPNKQDADDLDKEIDSVTREAEKRLEGIHAGKPARRTH